MGDQVTLFYDVKLILNMIQGLSGQILPTLLTRETSLSELQDEARRSELAGELSEFIVELLGLKVDAHG